MFAANLQDLLLAAPAGQPRRRWGSIPGIRTGVKVAVVDGTGQGGRTPRPSTRISRSIGGSSRWRRWRGWRSSTKWSWWRSATAPLRGKPTGWPPTSSSSSRSSSSRRWWCLRPGPRCTPPRRSPRSELPELDVSLRGAVSIARRLQDPLAELVKIDPKSIGVGQYQHDVTRVETGQFARRGRRGLRQRGRGGRQHRLGAAARPSLRASARRLAENIVALPGRPRSVPYPAGV